MKFLIGHKAFVSLCTLFHCVILSLIPIFVLEFFLDLFEVVYGKFNVISHFILFWMWYVLAILPINLLSIVLPISWRQTSTLRWTCWGVNSWDTHLQLLYDFPSVLIWPYIYIFWRTKFFCQSTRKGLELNGKRFGIEWETTACLCWWRQYVRRKFTNR